MSSNHPLERFAAGVLANIGIPHWLPVDPSGWLVAEFGTEAIHIGHIQDASAGDAFIMSAYLQLAVAAEEGYAAELCKALEAALSETLISDAAVGVYPGMRCDDGRYESILLCTGIDATRCEDSPQGRNFLSKLMSYFLMARSLLGRKAIAGSRLFDPNCHASAHEWSCQAAGSAGCHLVSPDGTWLSIADLDPPRIADALTHAGMDAVVEPAGFVRVEDGPFCVTVRVNRSSGRLTIQSATPCDLERIRGRLEAHRAAAALIANDTIPCRIYGVEIDGNDQRTALCLSMSMSCVDGVSTTMLAHWTRWILGCRLRLHGLHALDPFDALRYEDLKGI